MKQLENESVTSEIKKNEQEPTKSDEKALFKIRLKVFSAEISLSLIKSTASNGNLSSQETKGAL